MGHLAVESFESARSAETKRWAPKVPPKKSLAHPTVTSSAPLALLLGYVAAAFALVASGWDGAPTPAGPAISLSVPEAAEAAQDEEPSDGARFADGDDEQDTAEVADA